VSRVGLIAAGGAALAVWLAFEPRIQEAARGVASKFCEPVPPSPEIAPLRARVPRDRVRIADHSVVTDGGEILRAAHGNSRNRLAADPSWWAAMRDRYGLNAVRLDTRITRRPTNAPYPDSTEHLLDVQAVFASVDQAVDAANQAGMYLILANFTSCCGHSNLAINKVFWAEAATRYKDHRHVLFEVQNEPVEGVEYGPADVAFQEEMYRFIRERAPETHVILWSAMYGAKRELLDVVRRAPSIDYRNASVGIHLYWHDRDDPEWNNTSRLREHFPVFNTEFSVGEKAGKVDADKVWAYSERTRLAWAYLDLRKTRTGFGNYGDGVLHKCAWAFNWPIPAH
jgi:hypothetical protein